MNRSALIKHDGLPQHRLALIQEAVALTDGETVDHVIEAALREYIQRRKQLRVINLSGTIDYDEDYDYKQQRRQ